MVINDLMDLIKKLFGDDYESIAIIDSSNRERHEAERLTVKELKKYDIYPTLLNSLDKWKEDDKLLHFREGAENFLDKIAIKGKYVTYGPEVLFSYMLRKEREIQIIRTIAVGKLNGLSPEDIKKRTGELIA